MSDSPTSEPESDFVCDCEELMRSACAGERFYKEHEGKRYCVLHFPAKEKEPAFREAVLKKLRKNDFDFRGVYFPEVDFLAANFPTDANFSNATFFGRASFTVVTFGAKAD